MEQVGLVTKTLDDKIEIEVKRVSACGDSCKSCGSSCDVPNHIVVLSNTIGAKVGDFVELRGQAKSILKYTMIVYMIPFAMLIIGIFLGMKFFKGLEIANYEPLSFLIGLIFLALGYFFVRLIDNGIGRKENNTIEIVRII